MVLFYSNCHRPQPISSPFITNLSHSSLRHRSQPPVPSTETSASLPQSLPSATDSHLSPPSSLYDIPPLTFYPFLFVVISLFLFFAVSLSLFVALSLILGCEKLIRSRWRTQVVGENATKKERVTPPNAAAGKEEE